MRKPLWLVPALLLAGCRSEQLVLSPPAATSQPTAAAPSFLADTTLTATVAATRPALPAAVPAGNTLRQPHHSPRRASAPKLALPPVAKLFIAAPVAKRLAQHLRQRRPTEGVAESGLGQIGFFAIGVVLAILAGLAALVNVIFGVGFFTALGYTAAGLVVLVLLYSLFSGGKKKK
jgi:hypothetical protein